MEVYFNVIVSKIRAFFAIFGFDENSFNNNLKPKLGLIKNLNYYSFEDIFKRGYNS